MSLAAVMAATEPMRCQGHLHHTGAPCRAYPSRHGLCHNHQYQLPDLIGVEGSGVRRLMLTMENMGYTLLGAEDIEHPSRVVLRFDDGDRCITTVTWEDTEKP